MFRRIDQFEAVLPESKKAVPSAGVVLCKLLGGKRYGVAPTFGNYIYQYLNFRRKPKMRLLPSGVVSICWKEPSNIELVSNRVTILNNGHEVSGGEEGGGGDNSGALFKDMKNIWLGAAFPSTGGGATPLNRIGVMESPFHNDDRFT